MSLEEELDDKQSKKYLPLKRRIANSLFSGYTYQNILIIPATLGIVPVGVLAIFIPFASIGILLGYMILAAAISYYKLKYFMSLKDYIYINMDIYDIDHRANYEDCLCFANDEMFELSISEKNRLFLAVYSVKKKIKDITKKIADLTKIRKIIKKKIKTSKKSLKNLNAMKSKREKMLSDEELKQQIKEHQDHIKVLEQEYYKHKKKIEKANTEILQIQFKLDRITIKSEELKDKKLEQKIEGEKVRERFINEMEKMIEEIPLIDREILKNYRFYRSPIMNCHHYKFNDIFDKNGDLVEKVRITQAVLILPSNFNDTFEFTNGEAFFGDIALDVPFQTKGVFYELDIYQERVPILFCRHTNWHVKQDEFPEYKKEFFSKITVLSEVAVLLEVLADIQGDQETSITKIMNLKSRNQKLRDMNTELHIQNLKEIARSNVMQKMRFKKPDPANYDFIYLLIFIAIIGYLLFFLAKFGVI